MLFYRGNMNIYMVSYTTSLAKETLGQIVTTLTIAQSEQEFQDYYRHGYSRISRAQWRQLKREQKKAQKESELALQYADTTEHHNWVMGT